MIKIKDVLDEDFQDYKLPSMFIAMGHCDWKCCKEAGIPTSVCQNSALAQQPDIRISSDELLDRYLDNPITKAIVIGGLEPMLQFPQVAELIGTFREEGVPDDFVIYTGYYEHELSNALEVLKLYPNIVMKFGRYIPNRPSKFDDVLGITLVSDNQYGKRIS